MKCNYCGFESENNFIFCPNCGKEAPVEVYGDENPAANIVLNALKDKLFFIICILLTVASAGTLLLGNINVLSILATIFIWLVYNASTKNIADAKNLRCVSGTFYAYYVIVNVTAIIVAVCSFITLLFSGIIFSSALLAGNLANELGNELADLLGPLSFLLAASPILIFIVFLAVAAILVLLSIFGLRNIHKFLKSLYESVQSGIIAFTKCKTAETWLMVFGVLGAISSLSELSSSVLAFCSSAALAAVQIIASLLIKKYFSTQEQP